jgi:hypothetical protein
MGDRSAARRDRGAGIPGLKRETPRHAGAGWGTLRFHLSICYWECERGRWMQGNSKAPPPRCAPVGCSITTSSRCSPPRFTHLVLGVTIAHPAKGQFEAG